MAAGGSPKAHAPASCEGQIGTEVSKGLVPRDTWRYTTGASCSSSLKSRRSLMLWGAHGLCKKPALRVSKDRVRRKERRGNSTCKDPGAGRSCHGKRKQAVWRSMVRCRHVGQTMAGGGGGRAIGHREDPSLLHRQVSLDFRACLDSSVDKHTEHGLVLALGHRLVKCPCVYLQAHHT